MIVRHAYPQIPPKVEYEISAFGQSLGPVLLSLRGWGKQYGGSIEGVSAPNELASYGELPASASVHLAIDAAVA